MHPINQQILCKVRIPPFLVTPLLPSPLPQSFSIQQCDLPFVSPPKYHSSITGSLLPLEDPGTPTLVSSLLSPKPVPSLAPRGNIEPGPAPRLPRSHAKSQSISSFGPTFPRGPFDLLSLLCFQKPPSPCLFKATSTSASHCLASQPLLTPQPLATVTHLGPSAQQPPFPSDSILELTLRAPSTVSRGTSGWIPLLHKPRLHP